MLLSCKLSAACDNAQLSSPRNDDADSSALVEFLTFSLARFALMRFEHVCVIRFGMPFAY
jgi:hypothetical protein